MDYTQYFEPKRRSNGENFLCLNNSAPDQLRDFVKQVHFLPQFEDCLGNDWIYEIIYQAFDELDKDSLDDITIEADCYYYDLNKWLKNTYASGFCDYVLNNIPPKSFHELIAQAQYEAKYKIYLAVDQFITDQKGV